MEQLSAVSSENYSTSPDVIAELILKSIKDKKPKTRYLSGVKETILVIAARKLPYKWFDRLMEGQMKNLMK